MSAETLRKAAALMRDNAEQATPGPWFRHGSEDESEVRQYRPEFEPCRFNRVARCDGWEERDRDEENAAYIASWHPTVALAVADWLEREAALATLLDIAGNTEQPEPGDTEHYALAVARAYLGEATP